MIDNLTNSPWETISSKKYYEDKYLRLDVDQVRHVSGREHPHTAARFKVYGIAVLPVFGDGTVCLVGQYRYVLERFTWEMIRGSDPISLCPLGTARRELAEEIGAEAKSWLQLPSLTASPGITSELAPCFIAWNLSQGDSKPEVQETLKLRRLPFIKAVDAVLRGEIVDAVSAALILATIEKARRAQLPHDLCELLRVGGLES